MMYDKWLTDVEIKDNLINNTTLSTFPTTLAFISKVHWGLYPVML